jgi:biopolymer transport protein ExbB
MKFNLAHIYATMGPMSKLVALALVLMAIASIAVVVERILALSRLARETRSFAGEAKPLLEEWDTERLVVVAERYPLSALARLVAGAVGRFRRACDDDGGGVAPVELARREIGRKREALSAELRRGLGVLASVGSVAPFVGLLGTVVGIIGAFQSIGSTGSGGLGAVSAGIAEALVTTALGLFVAIPAVWMYNYFLNKVDRFQVEMSNSSSQLIDYFIKNEARVRGRVAAIAR